MISVPLAEVVAFLESGARPKGGVTTESGEVPSFGGEHVAGDGTLLLSNLKLIPRAFYDKLRSGRLQPLDILVVKDGATTGKTGIVRKDFPFLEAAVNEHVFIVRVNQGTTEPSYVYHFLRSPQGQSSIQLDFRGATVGGISRGFIDKVLLPVPPLSEQRRIASILDQADGLRAKRRAALTELDTLRQSIFVDMFGDPVTNPKRWPLMPIGKLGRVVTGNTPSRAVSEYFGNDIEWIKSDNINTPDDFVTLATEGLSASGRAVARVAPPSSILVTCIAGSPDCIGNSAMTDRPVAFNQQINALIPEQGDVDFIYVQFVVGKRLIQRASTSSMKGMVSKSRFERVAVMFPPIDRQRDFARRISAVRKLKGDQSSSLAHLDALFASLQHRAFLGEL